MSFKDRLADLGFKRNQVVEALAATQESNIRQFVFDTNPSLAVLAEHLNISISSAQKLAKKLYPNDYENRFGQNIHRSQEFRNDLNPDEVKKRRAENERKKLEAERRRQKLRSRNPEENKRVQITPEQPVIQKPITQRDYLRDLMGRIGYHDTPRLVNEMRRKFPGQNINDQRVQTLRSEIYKMQRQGK